uniref:Caspase family p20 domain-containing protein n=1 Tax=Anopheles maculatus TaxID=74869 RepID=A0A182TC45_9DIPT
MCIYRTQDTEYDLTKKAYVLVFHNKKFQNSEHDRQGSSKDMKKIKEILNNYRCDGLDIKEDCTVKEVQKKMVDISAKDFSKYSCLMVFIMSHGRLNDTIMGSDGALYCFHQDIVEQCTSNATLKGKPKIFAVQACRGDAAMETDAKRYTISDKTDIVVFQSSYHGTVSYRHIEDGSTFMQAFLRLLHANNQQSIIHVNTLLNREFQEKKLGQAPTLTTTLKKELIFGRLLKAR